MCDETPIVLSVILLQTLYHVRYVMHIIIMASEFISALGPVQNLRNTDDSFVWDIPSDVGECNVLYNIIINEDVLEYFVNTHINFDEMFCMQYKITVIPQIIDEFNDILLGQPNSWIHIVPGESKYMKFIGTFPVLNIDTILSSVRFLRFRFGSGLFCGKLHIHPQSIKNVWFEF